MADETFRPERRKITQQDVDNDPDDFLGSEDQPASLPNIPPMGPPPGVSAGAPMGIPPQGNQGPGLQISGNIPQSFREHLKRNNIQAETNEGPKKPSKMDPNRRAVSADKPVVHRTENFVIREGDSPLLKQLIDGINKDHNQYEEITLPSLGRFYDGTDGPKDGILHIRPMTGEEEQILATPRFVKKGQAINMIFSRCMKERFRPDDLLTIDRTFLLIFLRGISYSPEYDVEVKCPECDKRFSHTIELNTVCGVTPCPEAFGPVLEDVLPSTGYSVRYRLPRGKDDQMIQDYRERKARDNREGEDDTLVHRTAMLLEDVEGLQDRDDLKKLLRALPISDVAYLRNLINDPPFKVNTNVDITCEFCLHDFQIDLPLEANFFFPKARKKETE